MRSIIKPEKDNFRFAVDDNAVKSEINVSPVNFITINGCTWWPPAIPLPENYGFMPIPCWKGRPMILPATYHRVRTFFRILLDFGSYLKGGLDDVRLYNYVLTAEEITTLHDMGPHTGLTRVSTDADLLVYPTLPRKALHSSFSRYQMKALKYGSLTLPVKRYS